MEFSTAMTSAVTVTSVTYDLIAAFQLPTSIPPSTIDPHDATKIEKYKLHRLMLIHTLLFAHLCMSILGTQIIALIHLAVRPLPDYVKEELEQQMTKMGKVLETIKQYAFPVATMFYSALQLLALIEMMFVTTSTQQSIHMSHMPNDYDLLNSFQLQHSLDSFTESLPVLLLITIVIYSAIRSISEWINASKMDSSAHQYFHHRFHSFANLVCFIASTIGSIVWFTLNSFDDSAIKRLAHVIAWLILLPIYLAIAILHIDRISRQKLQLIRLTKRQRESLSSNQQSDKSITSVPSSAIPCRRTMPKSAAEGLSEPLLSRESQSEVHSQTSQISRQSVMFEPSQQQQQQWRSESSTEAQPEMRQYRLSNYDLPSHESHFIKVEMNVLIDEQPSFSLSSLVCILMSASTLFLTSGSLLAIAYGIVSMLACYSSTDPTVSSSGFDTVSNIERALKVQRILLLLSDAWLLVMFWMLNRTRVVEQQRVNMISYLKHPIVESESFKHQPSSTELTMTGIEASTVSTRPSPNNSQQSEPGVNPIRAGQFSSPTQSTHHSSNIQILS